MDVSISVMIPDISNLISILYFFLYLGMKMKKILVLVALTSLFSFPQQVSYNNYGLQVVDNTVLYLNQVEMDSTKLFADLEDIIPGVLLDIRYASTDNFYGEPVYPTKKTFLRLPAALALKSVQDELSKQNKALKVFDAYRPYSVTVLFYEKIKDTNFVASAWTGSRHNRGCAVDLTIVDLSSGKDLKMPSEYDDFTEKAAIDYMGGTEEERINRELLQSLMQKYGFKSLRSEWWHFDFSDWKKYEITDLTFNDLEKIYIEHKEINDYGR
jgi:zinc D-Ala-D-Ala dipeptidase